MQIIKRRDDTAPKQTGLRGVLVALGGNELDSHVMTVASGLVKGSKTPLYAVHVIEIPWSEAVDSPPDQHTTEAADRVLLQAEKIAALVGFKLEAELLQARTAGPAIVDEAAVRNCDLIVIGLPYKRVHGHFTLGDTVPYVLEHSPVQVWVVRGVPK